VNIGSLFSGGGGGDHGFVTADHQIVFGCEIDPKARSVFRNNHPGIPVYHDVQEVTCERLQADGTVIPDLIFGGSPCQDLSVAGNRAGLGGARSGLFHEQCRIADELGTPWVVGENVGGAFSSNKGEDFAAVLGGLTGHTPTVPSRGWKTGGVCVGPKRVAVWRVLDAQNCGVTQRRRRIFVVAGPRTLARRVVEVLVEPESSNRDIATSKREKQNAAIQTQKRVATSSGGGLTDIAQCIEARYGSRGDLDTESFILETAEQLQPVIGTLSPGQHGSGASTINGQDAYTGQLVPINVWAGSAQQENVAAPLLHGGGGPRTTDIDGATWVVHQPQAVHENQRGEINMSDQAYSLSTGGGKPGMGYPVVSHDSVVRRLTPLECERLMGWPDGWTQHGVDDDGVMVEIAITQRYRICGNGIVATVTEWIGGRLPG
jgi:DNA (cytosine-5)-methyltransferase 1